MIGLGEITMANMPGKGSTLPIPSPEALTR